jgi:hypothetical protein
MRALSVSCQITKLSVDFVLPCASSRRLMGLYANARTFNSSSMAVSRFEIVNAAA